MWYSISIQPPSQLCHLVTLVFYFWSTASVTLKVIFQRTRNLKVQNVAYADVFCTWVLAGNTAKAPEARWHGLLKQQAFSAVQSSLSKDTGATSSNIQPTEIMIAAFRPLKISIYIILKNHMETSVICKTKRIYKIPHTKPKTKYKCQDWAPSYVSMTKCTSYFRGSPDLLPQLCSSLHWKLTSWVGEQKMGRKIIWLLMRYLILTLMQNRRTVTCKKKSWMF